MGGRPPRVVVHKDLSCGCCGAWVDHLRAADFAVEVVEVPDVNRVNARLGVPRALASCHAAEVGGYVVEGHVPTAEVRRLLAEMPEGRCLPVSGMPVGSQDTEMVGVAPDTYEVILFGPEGRRTFARYEGARVL